MASKKKKKKTSAYAQNGKGNAAKTKPAKARQGMLSRFRNAGPNPYTDQVMLVMDLLPLALGIAGLLCYYLDHPTLLYFCGALCLIDFARIFYLRRPKHIAYYALGLIMCLVFYRPVMIAIALGFCLGGILGGFQSLMMRWQKRK